MIKKLAIAIMFVFGALSALQAQEEGWIKTIEGSGSIIITDDGSVYKSLDPATSSIWLPVDDVIITNDGRMINIDEHESVDVIQYR